MCLLTGDYHYETISWVVAVSRSEQKRTISQAKQSTFRIRRVGWVGGATAPWRAVRAAASTKITKLKIQKHPSKLSILSIEPNGKFVVEIKYDVHVS